MNFLDNLLPTKTSDKKEGVHEELPTIPEEEEGEGDKEEEEKKGTTLVKKTSRDSFPLSF